MPLTKLGDAGQNGDHNGERNWAMARKELPEGTVLLDVTDVSYASFAKDFLEKTGHQAMVCHGPTK